MTLSVIICTHNPRADYLQRVLDALKVQTLPKTQWEFLLIDNASEARLSEKWDLSWHPRARHVREDQLGLTTARIRGVKESNGELLVFVDDDNILSSDYLEQALNIARAFPQLGVWGGSIKGVFETEPPSSLQGRLGMLAVGEISRDAWGTIKGINDACPPGAGMVVRKQIAEKFYAQAEPLRLLLGRKGNVLTSGEDLDLAWFSCETGRGMGRFHRMQLQHLISARRLTVEYFERLIFGANYSNVFLYYFHDMPLPEPPKTVLGKLRQAKQRMSTSKEDRRFSVAAWDGVKKGLADLKNFRIGQAKAE